MAPDLSAAVPLLFPSPLVGEGGPQGRMRGCGASGTWLVALGLRRRRRSSPPSRRRFAHPSSAPTGHLLPQGAKGEFCGSRGSSVARADIRLVESSRRAGGPASRPAESSRRRMSRSDLSLKVPHGRYCNAPSCGPARAPQAMRPWANHSARGRDGLLAATVGAAEDHDAAGHAAGATGPHRRHGGSVEV